MNTITIYHYSNKNIDGKLKVKYFGENSYSFSSRRLSSLPRLYFYTNENEREYHLSDCKYRYIIQTDKDKLYNLKEDPLEILKQHNNIDDIFRDIISRGYIGVMGSNGFECVVLFCDVNIHKKEILR